jgi:hypothetical protein
VPSFQCGIVWSPTALLDQEHEGCATTSHRPPSECVRLGQSTSHAPERTRPHEECPAPEGLSSEGRGEAESLIGREVWKYEGRADDLLETRAYSRGGRSIPERVAQHQMVGARNMRLDVGDARRRRPELVGAALEKGDGEMGNIEHAHHMPHVARPLTIGFGERMAEVTTRGIRVSLHYENLSKSRSHGNGPLWSDRTGSPHQAMQTVALRAGGDDACVDCVTSRGRRGRQRIGSKSVDR